MDRKTPKVRMSWNMEEKRKVILKIDDLVYLRGYG